MGATSSRRSTVLACVVLAILCGSVGYLWTQYGANRALTAAIAAFTIFALVWLLLTAVSLLSVWTSKREPGPGAEAPLTNTQRPVAKRPPILPDRSEPGPGDSDEPPTPGRRRKNP